MSRIAVKCPNCATVYRVAEETLGGTAKCKKCDTQFQLQNAPTDRETQRAAAKSEETRGPANADAQQTQKKQLGRFEIRERLGSGAFGTVYRAWDPVLEREVALKVPHPGLLADEKNKQRYLQEPKAAAKLQHPNIVSVFDANLDGENLFVASAFIEGHTLKEKIEDTPLDFAGAAALVRKLAEALDYAHEHGIVHRDVKPANIMVDAKAEPMLMDFGLARIQEAADRMTHDEAVLGTPAYMSPEQAAAKQDEIGPASDQYSLGVVLYELLTGELPFTGPPSLVISLVQNEEPTPPCQHNASIPKDLETICLKAMTKEAGKRYSCCQELADDLRRWLDDEPILARQIGIAERLTRWCKRNPAIAGLTISVAVSLLLGAVVSSYFMVEARSFATKAGLLAEQADQNAEQAEANAQEAQQNAKELTAALSEVEKKNQALVEEQKKTEAQREEAERQRNLAEEQREVAEGQTKLATDRLNLAVRTNYNHQLALIEAIWRSDPSRAYATLQDEERFPVEMRGFVWRRLHHLCAREQSRSQFEGSGNLETFSKDGTFAVSVETKESISVWDRRTQKLLGRVPFDTTCRALAVSPDGRYLAAGGGASKSGFANVWDLQNSNRLIELGDNRTNKVLVMQFSDDSERIAVADFDGSVDVWDLSDSPQKYVHHTGARLVTSVAFSPNRSLLAVARDSVPEVAVIDMQGKVVHRVEHDKKRALKRVTFSPNGRQIAVVGGERAVVYDVASQSVIRRYPNHVYDLREVAYSSDGSTLAAAESGLISLWNANTGETEGVIRNVSGSTGSIKALRFVDNDRTIIAVNGRNVMHWQISGPNEALVLTLDNSRIDGLAFSPKDSELAIFQDNGCLSVCDLVTQNLRSSDSEFSEKHRFASGISYTQDGSNLLLYGGRPSVFVHSRTWTEKPIPVDDVILAVARDTETFSTTRNGRTTVWSIQDDAPTKRSELKSGSREQSFSPDAKQLAIAQSSPTTGGPPIGLFTPGIVPGVAMGGGHPGTLHILDIETESGKDFRHNLSSVRAIDFGPQGNRVAIGGGSSNKGTLEVWDVVVGERLFAIEAHPELIRCLKFSPDGLTVATGSEDNTVRVWDVLSGQQRAEYGGHAATVWAIAFSEDGKFLATGDEEGQVIVRTATPIDELTE